LVDAQEQERRALARELHDEFGQALTALKMEVGMALNASAAAPSVRTPLEEARSIADSTLRGIRDLSQLLHPSTLDDFGLPATITAYVRNFAKRSAIRVDVTLTGLDARLPAGVEVAVYRIVQEALTNVARHSDARVATVVVERAGDYLDAVIEDDGVGVPTLPEGGAPRGLGVIGMRERAQSLSGSLSIQPRQGGGTRVVVRIPIAPQLRNTSDLFSSKVPA
jgi:signal transduction histidine kinase